MKKTLLYFAIFFCSAVLYSAEPLVKFYLNDGSTKQYNLSEIDSLGVIDKKNNYVMRIHYDDTLVAYYPTEIIGSIKFEKGFLNVYIFSYPKPYKLSSIDSLIFYIDKWQPLTIGSQVWMLKNLNVDRYRNGDSIPEVRDSSTWANLKTGAWCYFNNSDSLGKIYGKLYNGFTVFDKRILAPSGWHVPTDLEWKELEIFLGMISDWANDTLWRGINQGGKLKESGTTHWNYGNDWATNESGFSALPTYFFTIKHNYYYGIGSELWSSSQSSSSEVWYRYLSASDGQIYRQKLSKSCGVSVRCIKDK